MYTRHYGLTVKPFTIVPDPNVLFLSKNHEKALTYLEYGISESVGFILLTGEVGIGKTTLIRHMINKMSAHTDIAVLFNTNFSSDQLFRRILGEFDLPCESTDRCIQLETLYHFLIEQYAQGRKPLLIIDEAQNLSDEVLEDIRMLFNLQTDNQFLLQVILVGQPDLKQRLTSPHLSQLAQRIVVNYHLSPLNEEQAYQYIAYRLQAAGGRPDLFSSEAMALVFEKSSGIPRTINLLCDAGLVYGYAENAQQVDRQIIQHVLKDRICLTTVTQGPAATPIAETPVADLPAMDLVERITAIETALADLQNRQETFIESIRSELDQLSQSSSASHPEYDHIHQEKIVDSAPEAFAFKDSAVAHTIEFETGSFNHQTVRPAPNHHHQRRPLLDTLIPKLRTLFRKKILPYLDIAYSFSRRVFSHRYAVWAILLVVPLMGMWILSGGEQAPSAKHIDDASDSAPPPALVSMNYGEDATAPRTTLPSVKQTPPKRMTAAKIHSVKSGETLLSIARDYGVSAKHIKKTNNLNNSHLIYVGQKLSIPGTGSDEILQLKIE